MQQGSEQQTANIQDTQQSEAGQQEASSSVEQQLEAEQRKSGEYLDLLRRTQADFVNYKRRAAQEQSDGHTAAQGAILEGILPILDDLGRALESVPPELTNHPWVQGILLVAKRLSATLEQLGLQPIGKPGDAFDPHWHEALMMETRSDVPEGTIVRVTRPGYAFGDRVVRPAQVIVANAP